MVANELSRHAFSVVCRDHLKSDAPGVWLPVGVLLLERVSLGGVQGTCPYQRISNESMKKG